MSSTSLLVQVRSAIVAGLQPVYAADPTTEQVLVEYAWKASVSARERIWTGTSTFSTAAAAMRSGRNVRQETGRFDLIVRVEGIDRTAEWTSTRALQLGQVADDWISVRKNNELGITGLQTLTIDGDGTLLEAFNESGYLADITYPVKYTARLS